MANDQLQEIEQEIKESQQVVDLANSFDRLTSNRDFRKIILEGYFKDEAIRLVHLKADPAMQTAVHQANIIKDIDAIGSLSGYFRTLVQKGNLAKKSIASAEEARDELVNEGGNL
jgi:hypothetical protein